MTITVGSVCLLYTSSVAGEKIENIPVPSVEMALQGKVAGLNVLNITGEPGAKGIVTLRGNTSIASQDSRSTPLYAVSYTHLKIICDIF